MVDVHFPSENAMFAWWLDSRAPEEVENSPGPGAPQQKGAGKCGTWSFCEPENTHGDTVRYTMIYHDIPFQGAETTQKGIFKWRYHVRTRFCFSDIFGQQ